MISEEKQKSNGYTMIPVLPETKDELAMLMPKGWEWDRCIKELTEMWKKQQGKKTSGKSTSDNQTS
jgi:hypothetical protein